MFAAPAPVTMLADLQGFANISNQARRKKYYDSQSQKWALGATEERCMRISMEALHHAFKEAHDYGQSLNGFEVKYFDYREVVEYQKQFFLQNRDVIIKDVVLTDATPDAIATMVHIKECVALSNHLQNRVQRTIYVEERVNVKGARRIKSKWLRGPKEFSNYKVLINATTGKAQNQPDSGTFIVCVKKQEHAVVCHSERLVTKDADPFQLVPKVGHLKQYLANHFNIPFYSIALRHNGYELTIETELPTFTQVPLKKERPLCSLRNFLRTLVVLIKSIANKIFCCLPCLQQRFFLTG